MQSLKHEVSENILLVRLLTFIVDICQHLFYYKYKKKTLVRPKHPNKDIERAIQYAESKNWRYASTGNSAHAWGRLLCPLASREG